MKIIIKTAFLLFHIIRLRPGSTTGLVIFGLGFGLIAGNAIFAQEETHPEPIWSTNIQNKIVFQSSESEFGKVIQKNSIVRSALTQPVSLKSIPVPTVNPVRNNKVASHTALVRDIQSVLVDIGFYTGKIDGIYGAETKNAIITYQELAGIIPNGEITYELLSNLQSVKAVTGIQQPKKQTSKFESISSPPKLSIFDAKTIARIQTGLKENFADENIKIDGVMGDQTKRAIIRFQKRFNIEASGKLNNQTLQKMHSVGVLETI